MSLLLEYEVVRTGMPLVELVVPGHDAARHGWLQAQLEDALRVRPDVVRVDLRDCPTLGSAELRALLDAHCELHRQGAALELTGLSPRLLRTVALAGLEDVFTLRP